MLMLVRGSVYIGDGLPDHSIKLKGQVRQSRRVIKDTRYLARLVDGGQFTQPPQGLVPFSVKVRH